MDIQAVHTELVGEARFALATVAADFPVVRRGAALEELSQLFQGLAICHLLEQADTEAFRRNLVWSGHARRYFLHRSREEGSLDDRRLALSRSEAILDAVVADLPLAREIALLSGDTWHPEWEYEDDYAYYRFVHLLLLGGESPDEAALQVTLERFENALEGGTSHRLGVCRALLERDAEAFGEAFMDFLGELRDGYDARRDALESYEFLYWPRSFVSTEGLALLRLASLRSVPTREAYPLCPSSGRLASGANQSFIDLFAELERLR